MQIEIAADANMAMDGRAMRQSLQNNSTPHLDLFVREGIQNSLDACVNDQEAQLEIRTGSLKTNRIARHFEGLEAELNARFDDCSPCLMLRDSGTAGLSGPVRMQDIKNDRGNLRKLVYEIGRPQENAGAGGSWGLGKTVYFRMGIGLVLYYSRFRNPDTAKYESRLAAAFVEDQTADDALLCAAGLSTSRGRGIAWWGELDPQDPQRKSTIPLTDENEILKILEDFDIQPYTENETGTTVLIPFIDEQKLLEETKHAPEEGGADLSRVPPWHEHLEDYLEIAVQRWYAPRLNNERDFGKGLLNISINGEDVEPEPLFRLVRELYHAGRTGEGTFRERPISVNKVELNSVFDTGGRCAGRISYIRLPKTELGVGTLARKAEAHVMAGLSPAENKNLPLIAYTRQPGMIVSYEKTGPWVPRVQLEPDEYVIGVFVPDSSRQLARPCMPFEEYLRSSEMADHMSWQDWPAEGKQRTIIKRIQEKVRKGMRGELQKTETSSFNMGTDLGLGRAIAQKCMPPSGFGSWDKGMGGLGTGGGGSGGAKTAPSSAPGVPTLHRTGRVSVRGTGTPIWKADGITVPVRLHLGAYDSARMHLRIRTEGSPMAVDSWEKSTGHSSPVVLCAFEIHKVYAEKELVAASGTEAQEQIIVNELRTAGGTLYGMTVTDRMAGRHLTVDGLLTYRTDGVEGDFDAEEAD